MRKVKLIVDGNGNSVVEYTYDTWGKQTGCRESLSATLGSLNPFRYRGYVFDEETGLYYLNSRYYDPETGRFINPDIYISTWKGPLGCNLYIYCRNNAVVRVDITGLEDKSVFIFYTSYTKKESSNGDGDFSKQAIYYANQLHTNPTQTNTAKDFIKNWNNMPDSVDKVYIFSHGNGMSLIFQNGEGISANGLNIDGDPITAISDLKSKTIGDLYLMSCNSGHLDLCYSKEGINAATAFMTSNRIERVHAFDGNMSFGPVPHFGFIFGYDARLAYRQKTFHNICQSFRGNRSPQGWITYSFLY